PDPKSAALPSTAHEPLPGQPQRRQLSEPLPPQNPRRAPAPHPSSLSPPNHRKKSTSPQTTAAAESSRTTFHPAADPSCTDARQSQTRARPPSESASQQSSTAKLA